jgi:hypothetical protein
MKYKKVIKEAWQLTQQNKGFMWWYAFLPEFIGLLVGMYYLVYQFMSFWQSPIFREYQGDSFLHNIWVFATEFLANNGSLGILLIVIVSIIVLLYLFLPIFCKASLVQLIARKRNGQEVKPVDGVSFGFLHFLPLFEYRLAIRTFSLLGLLSMASFVIRNMGPDVFKLLLIPFVLVFVFAMGLVLLLTYSEYFIIIDGEKVLRSMGKSIRLVIRHWQHTLLMLMLMVLITIRIFLNIILVLLIPALIVLSTTALAAVSFAKIGFVIGAIVGLVGLYFAAYLGGILEVFTSSVWVFTFLELTDKGEVSARESGSDEEGTKWAGLEGAID